MEKNRFATLFRVMTLFLLATSVQAQSPSVSGYQNAVKITFLSWYTGSTKLSCERVLPNQKQSTEICASWIGAGYDKYQNNPSGFTLRYGHKFFIGDRRAEALEGFYWRPELIYCHYRYDAAVSKERTLAEMTALLMTAGYQWVQGRFLADVWVGAGYAAGTPADTGYHHGFALWDYFGTRSDRLAMSFTVRLGWCF